MKKNIGSYKKSLFILFVLLFSFAGKAGAKTVYVKEPAVHLRSDRSTLSNVVTILRQDEALEVLSENKNWFEVSNAKGLTGWIAKRLVTEELPLAEELRFETEKSKGLANDLAQLQGKVLSFEKYKMAADKKIKELAEVNKKLSADNEYLSSAKDIVRALIGLGIFVIGWLFGFLTGFYKKQADNKRMESMMADAKYKFQ